MKDLFSILLLLISINLFSNPIELNDSISVLNLSEYTYIYSSKKKDLSSDEIINLKWTHSPSGANFGLTDKIYWVKYDFDNKSLSSKELVLYFPYHHINKIEVFSVYNNKLTHIKSVGTFYKYNEKDIKSRAYPVLINFSSGLSSIIIKFDHLYLPLRGTAFLLSKEKAHETINKNETIIWFWRGVFMFALFVTFILFFFTKINLFLYYFLMNLGIAILIGIDIGDFFMFFNSDPYNIIVDLKFLGSAIVFLFLPLFINELTPIKKLRPKLWKVMYFGIYLMPILMFICLVPVIKHSYFLYITHFYYIVFPSIVFIILLYLLVVGIIHKKKNAIILFGIYFIYITSSFLEVIIPNLGIKTERLFLYDTVMYSSIFEIFAFMVLMGRETLTVYKERAILLEKQKEHQFEIIKAIVESQEIERNKVGRELHDMIGANMSLIKQKIDKENKSLVSIINSTVESIRTLSHGLVTPLIKNDEFIDEINELCILFSNDNLYITSYFHNWNGIQNPEVATHLYRIVQELLQNAVKHSEASIISVQFIVDNNKLSLMYEDNGKGFDYIKIKNKGLGLMNIKNRIKLINGKITFDTMLNRAGTTIIIDVPKIKECVN